MTSGKRLHIGNAPSSCFCLLIQSIWLLLLKKLDAADALIPAAIESVQKKPRKIPDQQECGRFNAPFPIPGLAAAVLFTPLVWEAETDDLMNDHSHRP